VIGLFVYLGYFILARVGVQMGERGVIAPWLAGHLPTAVAFALGAFMLWRVDQRGVR
jgi:lipopolysaccharide export LptBFGC system permease protein LptF